MKRLLAAALALTAFHTAAQTTVRPAAPGAPTEFPADATTPGAGGLNELLAGKTFSVKLADGASWRLEYKLSGYYFVNTSSGFNGSGKWYAQDGKLCSETSSTPQVCADARVSGGLLYVKRMNGEVIVLIPK